MSSQIKNNQLFPFIDDIEADILPSMIINRKMWVDLSDHILDQYWKNKHRALIFKIFKVFFKKYKTFPTQSQALNIVTKKNYNSKVVDEIEKIYKRIKDEISLEEQNYLYDECKAFIRNNKIKTALLTSVDYLEDEKFLEIEDVMKDAVNWNPDVKLGTDIQKVEERFHELEQLSNNIIPSPWKSLNHVIGGGFYGKELTIFAASSSVGKSIILDNIAYFSWMLGYNVVMITLELSEVRKAQRMDAAALGIPLQDVAYKKDDVIKFFENKKRNNRLFIKEFPTGKCSTKDVKNYLHQLELYEGLKMEGGGKNGLNLILTDYLDIMAPASKKTGDPYLDQGNIGEDLRGLGQELDIPVLSACLDPETIVITKTDECKIKHLKAGEKVLSKNNQWNTVIEKKVYNNTKKYKITTESGKTIVCSANHIFPAQKGLYKGEYSINDGLSIGDKLYVKD